MMIMIWRDAVWRRLAGRAIILLLLVSVSACYGHIRTLNVVAEDPAGSSAHSKRRTLFIEEGQAIKSVLRGVAAEFSMTPESDDDSHWAIKTSDGRFAMWLEPAQSGGWHVYLTDWPMISRSNLSVLVEQAIRERLNGGSA